VTAQSALPQTIQGQERVGLLQKIRQLSDGTIIKFIIILAIFLRLASAVLQGNQVVDLPGIYDQISYDGLAQRVVGGYGFSFAEDHWPATRANEPTAHWSYLYTLYLVAVYKLFGVYPVVGRLIQALIAGIFQPWLIYRIGRRIFNETAGLVAAAWTALYIYFVYYAGALITETFYITGILWTFDCALRLVHISRNAQRGVSGRHYWLWLELGIALGVTVLLRQLFLMFLPFLFFWLWWNIPDHGTNRLKQALHWSATKGLTIAVITLVLLILPITIRNYRAFDTFVLLNTNAGFAFFWGNHPIHGTTFTPLLETSAQGYLNLIPKELLPLNEALLDKALLKLGFQFVMNDPIRFTLLSISRAEEFFKFWPSENSGIISNLSRVGSFGIALPFVLYGFGATVTQVWKSRADVEKFVIVLLLLFILIYTLIHLFSWTLIRYRLPVDAVLLIFAALGAERLIAKLSPSNRI